MKVFTSTEKEIKRYFKSILERHRNFTLIMLRRKGIEMKSKNQKASFVISGIILTQEGKFTAEDILGKVKPTIIMQFKTLDNLKRYIIEKLNNICEYGLVGKASMYYFSV